MAHAVARKLIFRLGEIGFAIDLDQVVEICEQLTDHFNPGQADIDRGIVGALSFRQTHIPVIDPALHLKTCSELAITKKCALILKGAEGSWALLVDQIDEIAPVDKFKPCDIPPLLRSTIVKYYTQISLWGEEPIIHFEPERYYGSLPVDI